METKQFIVEPHEVGLRIDKFLADCVVECSRSYIQKLIDEKRLIVNGKPEKSNYRVKLNDQVDLSIPDLKALDIPAEDIPLDIVYEDKDFLIINKPQDMVVHPAPGNYQGTLVNAVLFHCQNELSGINGVTRPGIVHRIDKNTSGLLVICKNDKAHYSIAEQLKAHTTFRVYEAIVYNRVAAEQGIVDAPIGRHPTLRKQMAVNPINGKPAITHYRVLNHLKHGFTHVELQLETGRTHQIRVHMASIHHPLLGDDVYGPKKSPYNLKGQVLHARKIGFIHPSTGQYVEFTSELPEYFQRLLKELKP